MPSALDACVNNVGMDVLQVFHLYVFLGIQDLLCLWIHVAGVPHSHCSNHLCHDRLHVLLAEC